METPNSSAIICNALADGSISLLSYLRKALDAKPHSSDATALFMPRFSLNARSLELNSSMLSNAVTPFNTCLPFFARFILRRFHCLFSYQSRTTFLHDLQHLPLSLEWRRLSHEHDDYGHVAYHFTPPRSSCKYNPQ